MGSTIRIDQMADAIMQGLNEYAELATEDMKKAVKAASKTVKKEIQAGAPQKSGTYSKSWAVKTVRETANSLEQTVHSKNRYQLAHLLEHGHAKRGGGRVSGKSHIAPAEQMGIDQLEDAIEKALGG
ncbi:MAG: HK97 gp10 family phage protein [Oscillospiraceae bacterium]|nr:HK97 gp10 family phage protein [Oscillospiraceae bacterium]